MGAIHISIYDSKAVKLFHSLYIDYYSNRKLHGKHSCLAYRDDYNIQSRLGFALQDISKNLPGAFLIYKADPEDDSILFGNHELINFTGCSDYDDFLAHTDQRFRNLIRPDEQKVV